MSNKNIAVDKIVEMCECTVISRGTASTVEKFCSDTRIIEKNDLFISLKSETADGITYIKEALENGAMGVITEYNIPEEIVNKYNNKLILKVKNITDSIQKIAKYKRTLYDIPIVAVTGSVGKTSTKDIIASVVGKKYNVTKTKGNYNNHIGVPLTILSWNENTEAAVVEMGMNHFGEIELLTNIVKPTIAIITNIGTAHIGILGSRENILKAKMEILDGLTPNGCIILNNDNDLLNKCDIKKYRKITYGIENSSNYVAYDIARNETYTEYKIKINDKEEKVYVPVPGDHFIYNSLCAIAVGKKLNIETDKIIEGIKTFEITGKRNEILEINDIKIMNDYYNASYDSMKASLEVLSNIKATRRLAILGDMLELGEYAEKLHSMVGEEVVKNKIDVLCTVGELSKSTAKTAKTLGTKEVYQFSTNEECINKLGEIVRKNDAILIKASNAMHFGEISKYLQGERLWEK
mgnify:FL=1|jgi:UDP-N-acetylmuramoyl-tripeptide--D-alanyl-D-alanine ligase